jgi:diguanylate cyclase (GGDEF)-like protein
MTMPVITRQGLSLTVKATLIIAGAWCAATLGIILLQSLIVLPTFVALEQREAIRDSERVHQALDAERADLAKTARDWAAWEETWMFVQGQDPGYAARNLGEDTFSSLDIQLLILLDRDGRPVWGRLIDPATGADVPVQEAAPAVLGFPGSLAWRADTPAPYAETVLSGYMRTAAGILMYASRPVLKNYEEGPVRGTLIAGKLLTVDFLERLRARVRSAFTVDEFPPGAPEDAEIGSAIEHVGAAMRASFVILDSRGSALARVTVERPAEIINRGRTTLLWSLGSLLVTLGAVVFALSLLLRRTILDPIGRLTRMVVAVRTTGTLDLRLGLHRADEVGTLGENFDAMLELLSEKTRALSEMATTDELTRLPNRRSILDVLAHEFARAQRYSEPLAVLMIDIDRFKDVNDSLGHAAGDAVLRGLAALLRHSVRDSDFAGRFGGEEFLVVLPHQDEHGALKAAERLRRKIAEATVGPGGLAVTVSIGSSTIKADGIEEMLARADRAMYAAKAAGRNRVCGESGIEGGGT